MSKMISLINISVLHHRKKKKTTTTTKKQKKQKGNESSFSMILTLIEHGFLSQSEHAHTVVQSMLQQYLL